ncbi:MAG TPA: rhodanese [Planctomycetaceae bacterium]|nr:rhodanese [Planctomycetaceae bacterium]
MTQTPDSNAASVDYPIEIDVHDVNRLLQSGEDFLFLDVRQPNEYETASLPGTILIPLGELGSRLPELDEYRNSRIVVHCHHGGRSMRAVMGLRQHGFKGAQNMAGGIDVWSQVIDPQVPRY